MLRDLGLEEWLFDIDREEAAVFERELLAIHDDYDAALHKVGEAMKIVRKRQAETMTVVKRTLMESQR